MSFAYFKVIRPGTNPGDYDVVELIPMTPVEGVPPRPTPGPTPPPGGGNGGPVDPGYSPPWAQVPPWLASNKVTPAATFPVPEGATPPADPVPAGWTVKLVLEKGADGPSWAYIGPHLQHNAPAPVA